ncbi:hypothetical protein Hypma_009546 [Hypsizygus marmoreus]|uniref:Uncharacterized protein n=1 Tax=Hypsizygus marmoreus TaxID=39966 RepID=A0A369JWR2_HYPMA|nr:hypothetical protein Hypma_009546 [Hypsizygus marmoreus]
MSTRLRHREDVDIAHEIQKKAAIWGALRTTAIGLGLVAIGHYSWPVFKRQTLAFKGFLVSGFTIFGLVFGAENALMAHEVRQRYEENLLRREARFDLARQGIIATETEIAKWKANRLKSLEAESS